MTATMTRPRFKQEITGGFGCRKSSYVPGGVPLEELLHPGQAAERREKARLEAEKQEAARREEAQKRSVHDAQVQHLRNSLPPVGSVLKVSDAYLTAHIHRAKFDEGKERLFVLSRIVDNYPTEPSRILVGSKAEEERALRCFFTYGSFQKVMQRTRGYLEHAGVKTVKVVSHAKSGRSINVEVAEL